MVRASSVAAMPMPDGGQPALVDQGGEQDGQHAGEQQRDDADGDGRAGLKRAERRADRLVHLVVVVARRRIRHACPSEASAQASLRRARRNTSAAARPLRVATEPPHPLTACDLQMIHPVAVKVPLIEDPS